MSLRKIFSLTVVVAFLGLVPLAAQKAESMDAIIETPALGVSSAAYLVLVASGRLPEDATLPQALVALNDQGWLERRQLGDEPITASEFAYLLTKAYNLEGGVLATWFPGPRYAYRDLQFRGLIAGKGDPDADLPGVDALRILGKVMDLPAAGGRP